MKGQNRRFGVTLLALFFISSGILAQQRPLQFHRPNDKRGLNVFESTKEDTVHSMGLGCGLEAILQCSFRV
jgi:hypothetical protein